MIKKIWKICLMFLMSMMSVSASANSYVTFRNIKMHYIDFMGVLLLGVFLLAMISYGFGQKSKKQNKETIKCEAAYCQRADEIESIKKGFENEEFKVFLQFLVDTKSKKIVAAEALSRWEHPEKGLLAPGAFLESISEAGLGCELDFYMFERVCRQLELWEGTEFSHIRISCNFTRDTLSKKDFVETLVSISNKYDFEKAKLCIEITEDAIEKSLLDATHNVAECKKLGFQIALDDLGGGYTSLSNLCDYPIDIVKIDRFLMAKSDKKRGRDLIGGIIALARKLDLVVVCEGVETKEQNEFVSEAECDMIQGWYYSKAMPVNECENHFRVFTAQG